MRLLLTLKGKPFFYFLFFFIFLYGCAEEPIPPEVKLVQQQEVILWREGAPLYLPEQYSHYKEKFTQAQKNLLRINSRFRWFRDYKDIRAEYLQLLNQGEELLKRLRAEKENKRKFILNQMETIKGRVEALSQFTLLHPGGGSSRSHLTKAEVALNEAENLYEKNQFLASEQKLEEVESNLAGVEEGILPVLNRYKDSNLISRWKQWAKETIEISKEKGTHSILIIKSEKKLILYNKGEPQKSYLVGMGKNGLMKKRYARDYATPEGKYRIISKNPKSRYDKALLLNYPNENDRREFDEAKKKGLFHGKTSLGGLIEIHGGGKEGLTYGCISLDNKDMEELYHLVEIGTPVTIVGALDERNRISSTWIEMQKPHEQKKTP